MLSHCLDLWRNAPRSLFVLFATLLFTASASAQLEDVRFGLHTQSQQNGVDESISDVRAFVPLTGDDFVTFLDTRLLFNDNGDTTGYNLGGGFRRYVESRDWIWGLNAFTDQRETTAARYRQVGFGAEMQFAWLETHGNVYLPIGTDRTWFGTNRVGSGGGDQLVFSGNHLIFGRTFSQQTEFEQSLRGFDFEFGGKLFDDVNESIEINAYLGLYSFENPDLEDIFGTSARFNINASDSIDLNVGVQHDDFFGTQGTVGLTVYSNLFSRKSRPPRNSVRDRMNDSVNRRGAMMIARGAVETTPDFFGTPLTNPDSSEMRFVHVESGAAAGGDGTFENPLNSVADVNANSQAGDNVYLYAGSVFDGQGPLVLQERQRLFGEGNNMTHTIESLERGIVTIPDVRGKALARPIIQNSTGRGIELATGASVTNISVIDSAAGAIWGSDVTGATIADSSFSTSAANAVGLSLDGASDVNVQRSTFMTAGRDAIGVSVAGTSQALISQAQVNTSGRSGFGLSAQDSASLIFTNQGEVVTSGILGIGVTVSDSADVMVDGGSSITTAGIAGYGVRTTETSTAKFDNASKITAIGRAGFAAFGVGSSNISLNNGSSLSSSGSGASSVTLGNSATFELHNGSEVLSTSDGGHGIRLQSSSTAIISGGSKVEATASGVSGIRVENSASLDLQNSVIDSENGDEIDVASLTSNTVSNVRIQNNVLADGNGTINLSNQPAASNSTINVHGANNAAEVAASNGLDATNVKETNVITYQP